MGYSTNGSITSFTPDDTEYEMWINGSIGFSLADIAEMINKKWPNATLSDIEITSEYIHTDCLYYDLYDAGDWTKYLKLELINK